MVSIRGRMPTTSEYILLCETCGYVLEGLPREGNCPECGRAIGSSLPEARPGTPWDRGPSLRTWLATGWMVVRSPRATFARARINAGHLSNLFWFNGATGAAIALIPIWIAVGSRAFGAVANQDRRLVLVEFVDSLGFFVLCCVAIPWVGVVWLIWLLTAIERQGLKIIGRAHGWRITPSITASVCSHASFGWVIAGVLTGAAIATTLLMNHLRWPSWSTQQWLGPALLAAAALAGLLIFETLVYIGVRRCKFANRARPGGPFLSHDGPGPAPDETVPTQPPA